MFARSVLVSAAVAFCSVHVEALPVHVVFEWPAGTPTSSVTSVRVRAIRSAGHTNSAAPVEAEGSPDGTTLDLAEGIWEIQAFAPGHWSQAAEVAVTGEVPDGVHLVLWPAASLRGEVVTTEGNPLPHELEVQLSTTQGSADQRRGTPLKWRDSSPAHATLHCRIEAKTWNCLAPAGVFDVRLQAAEYTPHYLWGVTLKTSETTDFGRTVLRQAASLFGRAVRKDGSDPPTPCQAILLPDVERHGGPDLEGETAPPSSQTFSAPLSRHGYFQIVGVLPGRHILAVECEAASGLRELRIQENGETRIDPPLRLEELTLDIAIMPNVDPRGQPWKLLVEATAPHFRRIANGEPASADGRWTRRGLMAGSYHVVASGSDGTVWLQRNLNLGADSQRISLRVGSVSVAGRALLNSQPVRARLVFSKNATGESATLSTDENGRFQGLLPAASSQETTWTVEAHVVQPPVMQRLLGVKVHSPGVAANAWLDLDFPAVPVRGSVVSSDGKPQANVQVTVEDSTGIRTTTGTDNAGRFEISDLLAGKYTAMADSPAGASDRTPFEVVDGSGSELRLVLNPFKRVTFYVVSSNGPVEDAAVQAWIAPGVPRAFVRTDPDGRFDVNLPPGTTEVGLTIGAPGYALKLVRLAVPNDDNDSRDARTITLASSAGTLVLNFQPPRRTSDGSATLYVVHNGAIQDARAIVGWGTNQAGAGVNGPATVDSIEPGDYALCRVDPNNAAVLWSGPLPSDRCSRGSLDESRTLTLSPP
jgi:carboxypeptidase family protein